MFRFQRDLPSGYAFKNSLEQDGVVEEQLITWNEKLYVSHSEVDCNSNLRILY